MKVKIKEGPLAGQIGQAVVVYYDVQHTGNGPDLCLVGVGDDVNAEMLSTELEIIEQPEPENKMVGRDEDGREVHGGDLVAWRNTILVVEWNRVEGDWQLRRVEGHYAYPTIRHLADMRGVGSVAGLTDGDKLREIERAWKEINQ